MEAPVRSNNNENSPRTSVREQLDEMFDTLVASEDRTKPPRLLKRLISDKVEYGLPRDEAVGWLNRFRPRTRLPRHDIERVNLKLYPDDKVRRKFAVGFIFKGNAFTAAGDAYYTVSLPKDNPDVAWAEYLEGNGDSVLLHEEGPLDPIEASSVLELLKYSQPLKPKNYTPKPRLLPRPRK